MSLHWPSALQRALMLPQLPGQESNPRTSRHPSGDLWKCILGFSISADLEDIGDEDDTNATRFVRIEHFGLSGVIFHSASTTRRASIPDDETMNLEIDALLERNAVQVLYFPNMACTSFVTGQVMKSHLLSDPTLCPKPRLSSSGFSINPRAFETVGHALVGGSSTPIRDLSGQLKPTPQCADRVLQDRHRAQHAARLLLAIRYRHTIRNVPKISTPPIVSDESRQVCMDPVPSAPQDAEDSEDEEAHDALDTTNSPLRSALRSNISTPSLDGAKKHPLLPNTLATIATLVDAKKLDKRLKILELAGEEENRPFV
ncbi:hypothetical protein C8R47DRAFT_1110640 [Mycena vitilis]|nr:hypothetical protein C8R47DRAFT_1110640 [Mycena vitilis]